MSYIKVQDENGNDCLVGLKRITKVSLEPVKDTAGDNDEGRFCTVIKLEPISKDDDFEYVYSKTPVVEIWNQIKLRM